MILSRSRKFLLGGTVLFLCMTVVVFWKMEYGQSPFASPSGSDVVSRPGKAGSIPLSATKALDDSGSVVLTVNRSYGLACMTTVNYALATGTAIAGSDDMATSDMLTSGCGRVQQYLLGASYEESANKGDAVYRRTGRQQRDLLCKVVVSINRNDGRFPQDMACIPADVCGSLAVLMVV